MVNEFRLGALREYREAKEKSVQRTYGAVGETRASYLGQGSHLLVGEFSKLTGGDSPITAVKGGRYPARCHFHPAAASIKKMLSAAYAPRRDNGTQHPPHVPHNPSADLRVFAAHTASSDFHRLVSPHYVFAPTNTTAAVGRGALSP